MRVAWLTAEPVRRGCVDAGGGPLGLGDIEEINGQSCLNCSWHHYKITIAGGEKLYESTEFDKATGKLKPAGWKSVGQKQRVHMVEERDGGVFVHLLLEGRIESDKYSDCNMVANLTAPDSTRGAINAALQSGGCAGGPPPGGRGGGRGGPGGGGGGGGTGQHGYAGKPSGQIFQGMR